jgi:hypothetical protein
MGTKTRRIEFWLSPLWDRERRLSSDIFTDALSRFPLTAKVHVVLEVKDRYRALRCKLAKRAALTRKPSKVKKKGRRLTLGLTLGELRALVPTQARSVGAASKPKKLLVPTRAHSVGTARKSAELLKKKIKGTF